MLRRLSLWSALAVPVRRVLARHGLLAALAVAGIAGREQPEAWSPVMADLAACPESTDEEPALPAGGTDGTAAPRAWDRCDAAAAGAYPPARPGAPPTPPPERRAARPSVAP